MKNGCACETLNEKISQEVNFGMGEIKMFKEKNYQEYQIKAQELVKDYEAKKEEIKQVEAKLKVFIKENKMTVCPQCEKFYFAADFEQWEEEKEEWDCVYQGIINSGENEYQKALKKYTYRKCPGCNEEFQVYCELIKRFGEVVSRDGLR